MRSLSTTPLGLLLVAASLAVSQSTVKPCVDSCIRENPTSTDCDFSKSGPELDTCLCETYLMAKPIIDCVRECPEDEIALYALNVPGLCREDIFPGVVVDDGGEGEEEGEGEEGDGSAEETGTETDGAGSTADPTSPSDDEEEPAPSVTSDGAGAEETTAAGGSGSAAAMGYEVPSVMIMMGGLVFALAF